MDHNLFEWQLNLIAGIMSSDPLYLIALSVAVLNVGVALRFLLAIFLTGKEG
jgi:hypothetical protein